MANSPKISLRLQPHMYDVLLKLAQAKEKSVTDLVRELLESSLSQQAVAQDNLLAELNFLELRLSELLGRAIKAAAGARYYAALAARDGEPGDQEVKRRRDSDRKQAARNVEQHYLNERFENL